MSGAADWARVKELFDAAAAQPPADRAAWLERACGGDDALRAEVASLIAAGEAAPGFLENPAAELLPGLLSGSPDGLRAGEAVGPYRLIERIGVGGMGTVWKAVHPGRPRNPVAVKVLWQGSETPDLLRRFANERQSLASLRHTNIARLLDGGLSAQGRPYLVMEFVDGVPLDRWCDEQRLPVARRLELLRAVCEAVHFAHRNLIVHRDLKPDNVLVTGDGTPKLLDFGIAKLLASAPGKGVTLTELRAMTPQYASPEQVRGEAVTTVADVYSLGVMLYESLTGRRPYRLPPALGLETQRIVTLVEPARPSALATREPASGDVKGGPATAAELAERRGLRPEALARLLAGDLDKIVMMAMRKDPARRYASAGHLAEEIRRFLLGLPVEAQEDTFGYRMRKFVGRNRLAVTAAALVFAALIAGVIGTSWQAAVAAEQAAFARSEANILHRVVELMNYSNRDHEEERRRGGGRGLAEIFAAYAADLRRELEDDPRDLAALLGAAGETFVSLGEHERALAALEESLRLRRGIYRGAHPESAEAEYRLANALWQAGRRDEALPLALEAAGVWRSAWGEGHVDLAQARALVGFLYRDKGAFSRAEAFLNQALPVFERSFGERHPRTIQTLEALAGICFELGDFARAEDLCRRAAAGLAARRVAEPERASRLELLRVRALARTARLAEARALLATVRAVHESLLGSGQALVADLAAAERELASVERDLAAGG